MTDILVKKGYLTGVIKAPSSKSFAHRMIIASAISGSRSLVKGNLNSKDIEATLDCIKTLGIEVWDVDEGAYVGGRLKNAGNTFNVKESGSTMRFLLPLIPKYIDEFIIYGEGRIGERTIAPLKKSLATCGVEVENEFLPTRVSGIYRNNEFTIDASLSSQYVTGLMFALTALGGGKLNIKGNITSRGYIDITIEVLKKFGVEIAFIKNENAFTVDVSNMSAPKEVEVNGDWSSACFMIVAALLNGEVTIRGLTYPDPQPDSVIVDVVKKMGGSITAKDGEIKVKKSALKAINFNADGSPDIVPILAVACAFAEGTSVIEGTSRLRIKESDRVISIVNMLSSVGVKVEYGDDYIKIYGSNPLKSGVINSYNDHRIAMSGVILGSVIGNVEVTNIECIAKSYPDFIKDFLLIGGQYV